jgi:hypothetical protein
MLTAGARFGTGAGGESYECPEASAQLREVASVQLSHLLAAQHQPSVFFLRVCFHHQNPVEVFRSGSATEARERA